MAHAREAETDLAVRAAWLSYVGGYTQEQIAQRLGVSRVKVHRLSALAQDLGFVKVTIEHELVSTVELENRLIERYGLKNCILVPTMEGGINGQSGTIAALGTAGAHYLSRYLDREPATTIGIGWGKTLSAVAESLLRRPRPSNRFVSVLGSLTRHAAANPYDVIHKLTHKTGAEGFIMPVPFIADAVADRALLMGQKSVGKIADLAKQADLYMLGIGGCGAEASAFESGQVTRSEMDALRAAGAVGDLLGRFFDHSGRVVDCEFNDRVLGLELEALRDRQVTAIAGGRDKQASIRGALTMGLIGTLITDEATAENLIEHPAT
ncbi:MAG: sugar-binding transcriptional regulator [Alphaproteobacteria bacterium]|nr:sugar-binding transcriptional regulator [Alphaproteobacteria bacterium]